MHGIYCLMNSGKPLTQMLADALLLNACDMFHENNHYQPIQSRQYEGFIESNLEVVEYAGFPAVAFMATVSTDKWEANEVNFVVRIDDLDAIEMGSGEWMQLKVRVMSRPLSDLPEEIQEKIRAQMEQNEQSEDDESPFSLD